MAGRQTTIKFDLKPLEEMQRALGKSYETRVGVLGASDVRPDDGEIGNADPAGIHELGSETNNIPARSFLRMPIETKREEIMKGLDSGMVRDALGRGDIKRVYQILGVKAEEVVQAAFSSGGFGQWAPLKQETIARKGSSAILIDEGELRRSVTSDVVGKDSK